LATANASVTIHVVELWVFIDLPIFQLGVATGSFSLFDGPDERCPRLFVIMLVRQPHLVMFEALSLVVASPGSGLV
jgi:hypothetical protein